MVKSTKLSGRYVLEERIAAGGMGSVFAATDERLGRRVAVKLLRDELADDPRFVERFRREARAVAALSHPNIANVFDYGEDDEHHYIVMEYVDGRDLARLMREQEPFAPERAALIVADACEALGHAHAAGVVHRDVKPANIMLDSNGRVKVTDFGIARAAGDSTLTATGSVLGTAHYLSPEQASGSALGPPSDLYSMGVVLYELLTGVLPFTGDSPIAIAMSHVSDKMPAPSSVNPDVPPSLDEIVAIATAKDPAGRYPSAAQMAAELRGIARPQTDGALAAAALAGAGATSVLGAGDETLAVSGSTWPLPGDRWDAHRLGRLVLITLVALVALAAALLLLRLFNSDEEPARSRRNGGRGAAPVQASSTPAPPETTTVTIPVDIVGEDAEKVAKDLNEAGLIVGETQYVTSEDFDEDEVVDSNPAPGSDVSEGDVVTLTVSIGEDDDHGGPGKPPGKGHDKPPNKEEDE